MGVGMSCGGGNATLPGNGTAMEEVTGVKASWYFLLGMGFTLLSSMAVSLGTVLMKKAHSNDQALPREKRAPRKLGLLLSRLWLFGFLVMAILQVPLTFAALSLAAQSLVIPLGAGSTIVFTQLLAVAILRERLGKRGAVATFFIVVGVVLTTTANAGGKTPYLSPCEILARYTQADFMIPLLILLCCLIVAGVALQVGEPGGASSSSSTTMPVESEGQITVKRRTGCPRPLLPATFAFVAGGLGAILNITLKVVGEFTSGAIAGNVEAASAWRTIHPYTHLVVVVTVAIGMFSYINQGLERFNAVEFLPLYNCLFIILSTLMGAAFFREFSNFSTGSALLFVFGILVTIFGIVLLSCGPTPTHVAGEEDFAGQAGYGVDDFGVELGQGAGASTSARRSRAPSDPIDQNYFDADLSADDKAFGGKSTPVVSRLVLI